MERWLAVFILLGYALFGASCENQRLSLRVHFPAISVSGMYADTLTLDDLRQIVDATLRHREITLPISSVSVDAPGTR